MFKLSSKSSGNSIAAAFAVPMQGKHRLENIIHVRNAAARSVPVKDVSDELRHGAWQRTAAAAIRYGVALHRADWRTLFARRGAAQANLAASVEIDPTR
jgi:hypothetical protein